jgi:hypothetical protein
METRQMKALTVTTTIERKHEGRPRFLCIPMSRVDPWKLPGTTTVEGNLNGVDIGRRSLKRWDDRNCWFMDVPDDLCRKATVETGDRVKLSLRIASEELPQELSQLIKNNPIARTSWKRLTPGQANVARRNPRRQTTCHPRTTSDASALLVKLAGQMSGKSLDWRTAQDSFV